MYSQPRGRVTNLRLLAANSGSTEAPENPQQDFRKHELVYHGHHYPVALQTDTEEVGLLMGTREIRSLFGT